MKRFIGLTLALLLALQLSCILPLYATEEVAAISDTVAGATVNTEGENTTGSGSESEADSEPISPEMFADFLKFDGYQVRETEYNGLRAMFKVNLEMLSLMKEKGVSLVEFGTVIASTEKLSANGDELTVSKNENGDYETLSYAKQFTIFKNGEYIGKYLDKSAAELNYACTVIKFNTKNFEKSLTFRGYTVLSDKDGNEFVIYSDYPISAYSTVDLKTICQEMFSAGTIKETNISYQKVQDFIEDSKWSDIWRP